MQILPPQKTKKALVISVRMPREISEQNKPEKPSSEIPRVCGMGGEVFTRDMDGRRACHPGYAKSEEECEAMQAEMIERVKAERKGIPTS